MLGTWMGDCSKCFLSVAANPWSGLDLISRLILVVGTLLVMYSAGARNLWSKQPLAPPAEDVITGSVLGIPFFIQSINSSHASTSMWDCLSVVWVPLSNRERIRWPANQSLPNGKMWKISSWLMLTPMDLPCPQYWGGQKKKKMFITFFLFHPADLHSRRSIWNCNPVMTSSAGGAPSLHSPESTTSIVRPLIKSGRL